MMPQVYGRRVAINFNIVAEECFRRESGLTFGFAFERSKKTVRMAKLMQRLLLGNLRHGQRRLCERYFRQVSLLLD
jgi:hypothetical protein